MFRQRIPTFLVELLLPSKFSGFVGHGLVKGCFFWICWSGGGQGMFFFEFVGHVMVKGTTKGPKERCWSNDGQGRSKNEKWGVFRNMLVRWWSRVWKRGVFEICCSGDCQRRTDHGPFGSLVNEFVVCVNWGSNPAVGFYHILLVFVHGEARGY